MTGDSTNGAMDAATSELLTQTLREMFRSRADGHGLRDALAELGWQDVRASDPATATTLLFTEHGRALATSRALDDIVLAEFEGVLPAPAGNRAVLYPHPAAATEPSPPGGPLHGLLLGPLDEVDEVVVPTVNARSDGSAVLLQIVPAPDIDAMAVPTDGFDPTSGWLTISGGHVPEADARANADFGWVSAMAAAHRALAAEIVGVCEAALEAATEHVSSRMQFGRPVGSFQAVRHRLAEAGVAVAGARSMLDAAWSARAGEDAGSWAAMLAKLQAGRAQAELMPRVVQACGAMGLSAEGTLHRYVTRGAALDGLLGGHVALSESMAPVILDDTGLDAVVEL